MSYSFRASQVSGAFQMLQLLQHDMIGQLYYDKKKSVLVYHDWISPKKPACLPIQKFNWKSRAFIGQHVNCQGVLTFFAKNLKSTSVKILPRVQSAFRYGLKYLTTDLLISAKKWSWIFCRFEELFLGRRDELEVSAGAMVAVEGFLEPTALRRGSEGGTLGRGKLGRWLKCTNEASEWLEWEDFWRVSWDEEDPGDRKSVV